jgi:hypothetical protein
MSVSEIASAIERLMGTSLRVMLRFRDEDGLCNVLV